MKYLLIIILLTSCGGDTQQEEVIFNGISYMDTLINNVKVVDDKLVI